MFHEMKRLLKITCGVKQFVFLLILRSPTELAMTIIQAVFLQNAFNTINSFNDINKIGMINAGGLSGIARLDTVCIVFIISSLCIFLYNGTVWSIYAPFVVRMESRLRVKLFDKIMRFSYERIEATPHGEWVTRLNTDVQMPFSQPIHLPHAVNAILRICVVSVILSRMNPAIFGWVMLFNAPHIMVSQLLVARAMPQLNKNALEATAGATGELAAFVTCADTILLYDAHDLMMKRFENSSLALMRAKMRICKKNALNAGIVILFALGGYFVLLIVGGNWIAGGSMTFGDLTGAFQYRMGLVVGSNMLINCLISIQASMAGIRRINDTMYENADS